MSKYLNYNSKGEHLGAKKVTALEKDGAVIIDQPNEFISELIVVISNGSFDAVLLVDNKRDFQDAVDPSDPRQKTWMIYEHAQKTAQ